MSLNDRELCLPDDVRQVTFDRPSSVQDRIIFANLKYAETLIQNSSFYANFYVASYFPNTGNRMPPPIVGKGIGFSLYISNACATMNLSASQFQLTEEDRIVLRRFLKGGIRPVRAVCRAQVLLSLDEKRFSPVDIARAFNVSTETVKRVKHRYLSGGLENVLKEKPRSGKPPLINEDTIQQILEIAKSSPPPRKQRWSIRLIAKEATKRNIAAHISKETVRLILKSQKV